MVLLTLYFNVKYAFNINGPSGYKVLQNVTLAVGAGIYEEILFRVVLIFCFNYIISLVFQWKSYSKIFYQFFSSIFFSLFHFIGEFGDYYSFDIFMVRFLGYLFRYSLLFPRIWYHSMDTFSL